MDTGNKGMDAFEQQLRNSLSQFEVPYNSADWTHMERALDGNQRGGWITGAGVSILVAGLALMAGGTWYAWDKLHADGAGVSKMELSANAEPAGTERTVTHEGLAQDSDATPGTDATSANDVGNGTDNGQEAPIATIPAEEPDPANAQSKVVSPAVTKAASPTTPPPSKAHASKGSSVDQAGVTPEPEDATFRSSVTEGCPGTSVDFKVSNMSEDGIYLWNFGDGSFSNKANPEHTFTKPGTYQVMLSMSAVGVGSIQNKPSSEVIVIHEAPMAAFNVLKQEYDGHLPSVHFENRSLAGKSYLWDFGDGQTSTIAHPDHIYKKKGVYHVELTVANGTGCVDKLMKDVIVEKDYNLDAAASFSPNGDNFQETFMPEALRTLGLKFNLQIYAPNGTLLYQTTDASKPWTGRPQNRGNMCAPDEYVWVADVRESLHLSETYTGKVRLER